jgi:hypothetical protein
MESLEPLFVLGQITVTEGISESLAYEKVHIMIAKHVTGDFGILGNEDIEMNKEAIKSGKDRILSAYLIDGVKVYVITEWDRSYTTVLFADEY